MIGSQVTYLKALIHIDQDLESYPLPDWVPVQFLKVRCGMISLCSTADKLSHPVLYPLYSLNIG